ncbi:MAG: transposase [Planctomycetaceae bacterium]
MKRVARMLRHHQTLIRNCFVSRGTMCGGVVEGLNKQAKLIIKKRWDFGS